MVGALDLLRWTDRGRVQPGGEIELANTARDGKVNGLEAGRIWIEFGISMVGIEMMAAEIAEVGSEHDDR